MTGPTPTRLRLSGIAKTYGGIQAVRGVSLDVRRGEILALCGENGAGKSTLVKILAGVHRADGGELLLGGQPRDAAWAREHGFATEVVAPQELEARIEHWTEVFSRTSRDALAATKAMLNERFGQLLAAAMDRETHHCVRLFDEPDARAALNAFAEGKS